MNTNLKTRFWKTSKYFTGLFTIMFVFRLIYGFLATNNAENGDYSNDFFRNIDHVRKNYASEKMAKTADFQNASTIASNQKFEKTASIKSKSSEFEKDENIVKEKTKAYNAVIQYEQNLGQKGNRQIHLLIGVNPEKFDTFYLDMQKIGIVKNAEVTKVDKTNEYRQLNAKKTSIQNTLKSLTELKSKGGEISDFVALNDKILEIEEKLQELGVELGNFDAENEFCTVKLSLYEGATNQKVSLIHRIKVALEWTIKYFTMLVFAIFIAAGSTFILLFIIDKLKIFNGLLAKFNDLN